MAPLLPEVWALVSQMLKFLNVSKNTEQKKDLKHLCRETIRKHLIDLDPHEHFGGSPSLKSALLWLNTCSTIVYWIPRELLRREFSLILTELDISINSSELV